MMLVCLGSLKKPNKSFLMVAYKPKAVMGYVNLPLDSSPFELKFLTWRRENCRGQTSTLCHANRSSTLC